MKPAWRFALAAAWCWPVQLSAQAPARSSTFNAGVTYSRSWFSDARGPWSDWTTLAAQVGVRSSGAAGSVRLFRDEKFAQADVGGTLDVYRNFGKSRYANATVTVVPDAKVNASSDVSLELYQGLSSWELSGGLRHMSFSDGGASSATVAAAKYVNAIYLQLRGFAVRKSGETALAMAAVARYQRDARAFAELRAGRGNELVTIAAGPVLSPRRTGFVAARAQGQLPGSRFGISAGLGRFMIEGVPNRMEATIGAFVSF